MLSFKNRLFYGWVVVANFLITGTILWGVRLSFGVFFKSIERDFDLNRAATASIFSLYMLFGSLFAILGGWALDKYGPRVVLFLMGLLSGFSLLLTSQSQALWQLFLTYSLLLALGTGAMYVVSMSTVSRWFNRKRGLALGIASSGVGTGTLVVAPLASYLIGELGWRLALLVLGLITWFVTVPLSRILKGDPYEIGALPDGLPADSQDAQNNKVDLPPAGLSLLQALKTRSFWLIMWIWLLFGASLFLVLTHLVPHATDIGISAVGAATILSLIGVATIVGRVGMGVVADRGGRKSSAIICALLQIGCLLWLIWLHDLWAFYLFALFYGFAYGGITPGLTAIIGDTFGLVKLGMILGVLDVGFGVGSAIGPAIGGWIFDVMGSYWVAFLSSAIVMLVVTLLIVLIKREAKSVY